MAHEQRPKARYVQHRLTKELGVTVSYAWALKNVLKHLEEAEKIAAESGGKVEAILVKLIRPLRRTSR